MYNLSHLEKLKNKYIYFSVSHWGRPFKGFGYLEYHKNKFYIYSNTKLYQNLRASKKCLFNYNIEIGFEPSSHIEIHKLINITNLIKLL